MLKWCVHSLYTSCFPRKDDFCEKNTSGYVSISIDNTMCDITLFDSGAGRIHGCMGRFHRNGGKLCLSDSPCSFWQVLMAVNSLQPAM